MLLIQSWIFVVRTRSEATWSVAYSIEFSCTNQVLRKLDPICQNCSKLINILAHYHALYLLSLWLSRVVHIKLSFCGRNEMCRQLQFNARVQLWGFLVVWVFAIQFVFFHALWRFVDTLLSVWWIRTPSHWFWVVMFLHICESLNTLDAWIMSTLLGQAV